MRLVTLTQDIPPWQAGNDYALKDMIADQLIGEGKAKTSPRHAASGLKPDEALVSRPTSIAQVIKNAPRSYLTRAKARKP
jgi:hypothetical protein